MALNFIDLTLGAEVLVSDKGIVGCAKVSAFGFTWSPGVGYTWATHSLDLMASGCSVGPWKTLGFGQAFDATAVRRSAQPGRALIELRGSTGVPKVKLTGPAGQHVTVPAGSVKPFMTRGLIVFQDPADSAPGSQSSARAAPGGSLLSMAPRRSLRSAWRACCRTRA